MNNPNKIRWLQRFENFSQALSELTQACNLNHYDNLQRAGLVKTFEFCLGLSWNVLKDLLSYEGYDVKVPREVIRKAFEAGYINEDDCETLLEALDKRNILNHVYRKEVALEAEDLIKNHYHPAMLRLYEVLDAKSR